MFLCHLKICAFRITHKMHNASFVFVVHWKIKKDKMISHALHELIRNALKVDIKRLFSLMYIYYSLYPVFFICKK